MEQAPSVGGTNSAIAAMDKLKGEALTLPEAFDVDGEPTQDDTGGDDLERDDWEWSLTVWPEALDGAQNYELKTHYKPSY